MQKDIYQSLVVFIDSNIRNDRKKAISIQNLEVLSPLCALLDSDNKLTLAMRLVKKLERLRIKQEQLSERHQKLLSYLITGAAANLSKSEEVEKTVLLLRLCVSIICQINSKKEIVTYYDASILDNSCLLLLKCLAHVEHKRVIEIIEVIQ